jgi:hypothetical protein
MEATRAKLAGLALICGIPLVWIDKALNDHQIATSITFWFLLPGILAGALLPDSGFSPEGDTHPWGPVSTFIAYAVNIGLYSGLFFFLLCLIRRHRTPK